jgi:hypothetical protein
MLLALIIPRALVYPNRAWMTLAEGMSYVSTRIILAIVFFGVLTPIGLIKRAMGGIRYRDVRNAPIHTGNHTRNDNWIIDTTRRCFEKHRCQKHK